MFYGCTSLVSAPDLPATTIADSCYLEMFSECTSLAFAPSALPATTLDMFCYQSMFNGCSALAFAPVLPATTLAECCYNAMFYGCSSLSEVNVSFTDWNEEGYSTGGWLDGVSSTGIFNCPAALDTTTRDANHVPEEWVVVNA